MSPNCQQAGIGETIFTRVEKPGTKKYVGWWQTKNRIRDIHHVDVQTICLLIRHEVIHIWGKSSGIRIYLEKSNLEKSKKNREN